jgi:5-methylcytosine-specific restriction endonuclease McrA
MSNPRWYRELRTHVLRTKPPVCALCGQLIDLTLSGLHPDGPHVDHIVPRSKGGQDTYTNLQPTHRRCNLQRGNRPLGGGNTSRDW